MISDITHPNTSFASVQFIMSDEQVYITRKVDTIIMALTDTGGFMSILFGAI